MFLKPANSDMEMALKNQKMSPEKKSYTAETRNWKIRIIRPLPHFLILIQFFISKRLASLTKKK